MIKRFKLKLAILLATIMFCLNVTNAFSHTNEIVAKADSHVHNWYYYDQTSYTDHWWTNTHGYSIYHYRWCVSTVCKADEYLGLTQGTESHSITRSDSHLGGNKHIFSENAPNVLTQTRIPLPVQEIHV